MQDIELAGNSQEVTERFYNLLAVGEGGRCPNRVKTGKAHNEQMSSGLPPIADMAARFMTTS